MDRRNVDSVAWGAVLVGGLLGLLASFVLSVEALTLAKNPNATLDCSLNIVLNCATVAQHSSSELLGFPNSFIGMVTLPVMITIAVAALAGVVFPRWFMRATWAGAVAGVLFALWMFFESYFVIQALCPWCLLTDVSILLVAYGVFRHNARQKIFCVKPQLLESISRNNYDLMTAISVLVVAAALVIIKFGDGLFA